MTAVWPFLYIALTLAAGALLAGQLGGGLRFEERLAITPVLGIIGGTLLSVALAQPFGLNLATVLGGPLALAGAGGALAMALGDPGEPWRESWRAARPRNARAVPWRPLAIVAAALLALIPVYGHGIFERDGSLLAGYAAVWADWSNHLSRAAAFGVAGNPPSLDPLFSGTTLRYPFLPDFHSAMLAVAGLGPGLAYALPLIGLCLCITCLVICIARRLGAPAAAGAIAVVICFLGGGLGFVGLAADACAHHGFSAGQCSVSEVVRAPVKAVEVAAGTLHDVPGLIAAQPRAYDGLGHENQPISNLQWYTPLMAWWLPQTGFVYGFAVAMTVLLLVLVAMRGPGRQWPGFVAAGVLAGMLPLIHLHSLIALLIVLPVLALRNRRREWLGLAGACAVIALPRLVQLALGPHGTASAGNQFPWLEPGWMWNASAGSARVDPSPAGVATALGGMFKLPFTPGWWQFWLVNLGVALPLCLIVIAATLGRRGPPRLRTAAQRVLRPFPPQLLSFCLPFMLIFAIGNLVIFQSWDWDNTKLFAYWYFAVALLSGTLISHWFKRRPQGREGPPAAGTTAVGRLWRPPLALRRADRPGFERVPLRRWALPARYPRRLWRPLAAMAMLTTMLLSGVLVTLRLLPWTPAAYASAGPYTIAAPEERRLAADVAARTSPQAVFLTPGRPNDPILVLAGRTSVMAYYGWLWSYGTDFGTRPDDIRTMYRGCAATPAEGCPVAGLLRRYDVSYVEVDDRVADSGVLETGTDPEWWRSQRYPVVAGDDHIVIYDVRRR